MDWYQVKQSVVLFTGLHMDALHVHIGVLAQLLTAMVLRRSLASPVPWLLLLAAVGANEWFDLSYESWPGSERERQYEESIRDGWNTMLLPTLLLLLSRWAPGLLVPWRPTEAAPADDDG
jgi:hypothetical protein